MTLRYDASKREFRAKVRELKLELTVERNAFTNYRLRERKAWDRLVAKNKKLTALARDILGCKKEDCRECDKHKCVCKEI